MYDFVCEEQPNWPASESAVVEARHAGDGASKPRPVAFNHERDGSHLRGDHQELPHESQESGDGGDAPHPQDRARSERRRRRLPMELNASPGMRCVRDDHREMAGTDL